MTFSKFEIYFQVINNCHLKMGINFFGTPCIVLTIMQSVVRHPKLTNHEVPDSHAMLDLAV